MLSWLRSARPGQLPHRVDFFYTSRGNPPLVEEVTDLAGHHEELHLHLVDTEVSPRLTVDQIMTTVDGRPSELSAFLCGPESMVDVLQKDLGRKGVKAANVHREYYNLR
jgi:predicted ferric reductase